MPQSLRTLIHELVTKGHSRAQILQAIRDAGAVPYARQGGLTYAACVAAVDEALGSVKMGEHQ